jgi:hypothetical protein
MPSRQRPIQHGSSAVGHDDARIRALNAKYPNLVAQIAEGIREDIEQELLARDRVFQELFWMTLGAPDLTDAKALPGSVAVPRAYRQSLANAVTKTVLGDRKPRTRPRPSRLAYLIWLTHGRKPKMTWEQAAETWSQMTAAWSEWLASGKNGPPPALDHHREAAFAFAEWRLTYGRSAKAVEEDRGHEPLEEDRVREIVMKRSGPSVPR